MADTSLASGTYEVLRHRLREAADELRKRFELLNQDRAAVFGNVETKLQTTAHVTTDHNCVPRDLLTFGSKVLLGYNVQFGLKTSITPTDVLSLYDFDGEHMRSKELSELTNERFDRDFTELYRYYRGTKFSRFFQRGPHLHMVFQVGKTSADIKTFKFVHDGERLEYVDNRSESEVRPVDQHAFVWTRSTRDSHRHGTHPHISIEDRIFVECVGGDLTVKIEDNTQDGLGIYREPVDNPDQTLDDAEVYYAILGSLIVLKVRPYQERAFRYLVYTQKRGEVWRLDAIGQACVLLPDDHGIIFPDGYCLQTGECKRFDHGLNDLVFERAVSAPNGEDFLYLFYQHASGTFLQFRYNLIRREVDSPHICHGQAFFEDGRMLSMKAVETPQKHHALQLWQTPFTGPNYRPIVQSDSMLFKIGNRELVRGMAECREILHIIDKDESYVDLYADLVKRTTDILDGYFWINRDEARRLSEPLEQIREAAGAAVSEYEKVVRVKRETAEALQAASNQSDELLKEIDRSRFERLNDFVDKLHRLRSRRGETIQLRERRYIDLEAVTAMEERLREAADRLGHRCVLFLVDPKSLQPYRDEIDQVAEAASRVATAVQGREFAEKLIRIGAGLELLIETVSQLKIDDLTQRTTIVDGIGELLSQLNRRRSTLRATVREITTRELEADYGSQMRLLDEAAAGAMETADSVEAVDSALTRILVQLEELEGRYSESESLTLQLAEKRQTLCDAFEARREALVEQRSRRADALATAADRMLVGIAGRCARIDAPAELHAFFAADPMVDKVRGVAEQLRQLGDTVRMEDLLGRLKTIADDAVRMQRDRKDLLSDGQELIKLGLHRFAVNQQSPELTMIVRSGIWHLHVTGTQFFEPLFDSRLESNSDLWGQSLVSETESIYRGEFLAYRLWQAMKTSPQAFLKKSNEEQITWVREQMQHRPSEGYARGVHDHDAAVILNACLEMDRDLGLLRFDPALRSRTWFTWRFLVPESEKQRSLQWLTSLMEVEKLYPDSQATLAAKELFEELLTNATCEIPPLAPFSGSGAGGEGPRLQSPSDIPPAGEYLLAQLKVCCTASNSHDSTTWICNPSALQLVEKVRDAQSIETWNAILASVRDAASKDPFQAWQLVREIEKASRGDASSIVETLDTHLEACKLLLEEATASANAAPRPRPLSPMTGREEKESVSLSSRNLKNLAGDHSRIQQGILNLNFHEFSSRLGSYVRETVPRFQQLQQTKQAVIEETRKRLRTEEFKPRVLTSFVRNHLIDSMYLPRIGENLAKQIGAAGDAKRTDRMGLLLLVSPPGYGKTTLMEYIANRLGMILLKINGPALGSSVTSLDPSEAPNASAREEVRRINLALEMGDNVMLYLDDIQHCHSELLQKFIPLCDATRRIEGVWNDQPKTYDLRGRRFAVVMAGNPYTESGHRFHIPDMLANRADVYNLGEIIGNSREAFELSYLENCLTNNTVLQPLARSSSNDQRAVIAAAERGTAEGLELEGNFSPDQIHEMLAVLKKLHRVRDVVLQINREYIKSAAQADEYRTEPPFKLQGSYRNMNRIAEKVVPVMNDAELERLILSNYEQESQTLSRDGESNMLKFKELLGLLTPDEKERWEAIQYKFAENLRLKGLGSQDSTAQLLSSLLGLRDGLESIRQTLKQAAEASQAQASDQPPELPEQKVIVQHSVPRVMTDLIRSQFQLLYDGLRPLLEQSTRNAQTQERLKTAIEDCLARYNELQEEAQKTEET